MFHTRRIRRSFVFGFLTVFSLLLASIASWDTHAQRRGSRLANAAESTLTGAEFVVNSTTTMNQTVPQIAALTNGGFAIVWEDDSGSDGVNGFKSLNARVFGPTGTPVANNFVVNTANAFDQSAAQITALTGGGFVITWCDQSNVQNPNGNSDIRARVFPASGSPAGAEFIVNNANTSAQTVPQITALTNGGFVIVWEDASNSDGGNGFLSLNARVFDATGTPLANNFVVNTANAFDQAAAQITALTGGGFVITWRDDSGLNNPPASDIRARVYPASGTPAGAEFVVNSTTTKNQTVPQIAALTNGGFVVVWNDDGNTDGGNGVNESFLSLDARIFDATGTPLGSQFTVNTANKFDQTAAQIVGLTGGGFVITWRDDSGLNNPPASDIRARIYPASGTPAGTEFVVNSTTTMNQTVPQITALNNGGFAIVWEDDSGSDNAGDGFKSLNARMFNAAGVPAVNNFVVNKANKFDQAAAQITTLTGGDFVITWRDDSGLNNPPASDIRARIFSPVASTASNVSVSGRVMASGGRGLTNAVVTLTGPDGSSQIVVTGRGGAFNFDNVETGKTYILSVGSQRFAFEPQTVTVNDNVGGLVFMPEHL